MAKPMDGRQADPRVWPKLAGKTVGLLGYGRIGAAVAQAFDMTICAIRRHVSVIPEDGLALLGGPDTLNDVLRRADYLVIAMPATAATKGAIDRRALALMKPSAFLINIARRDRR